MRINKAFTIVPDPYPMTKEEVDKVGLTIYTRFYPSTDTPDYKSAFAEPIRRQLNSRVKEVVEALRLNGYSITKDKK